MKRRRTCREQVIAGALFAAGAMLSAVAADGRAAALCVGDCDGNGVLAINELIVGVNMALGSAPQIQCPSFDADQSGRVTVNELIAAVNNALNGCPRDTSGVLLEGPADMPALDAVHDLDHEGGSPSSEVSSEGHGRTLVRTRIELGFTLGAMVGQVNALLDSVGGRILMMLGNVPILLVQIPDPGSVEALNTLVGRLAADPIVRFVRKSYLPRPDVLPNNFSLAPTEPFNPDFSMIDHNLAVRAPAAWNARTAIRTAQQPTVVIQDYFGDGAPVSAPGGGFAVRLDQPSDFVTAAPNDRDEHGYHVAGIIAASFGGTKQCANVLTLGQAALRDCATGMFPGTTPLRVVDLTAHIGGHAADDKTILILKQLAAAGVNGILNTSLGNPCQPADDTCVPAEEARQEALVWIEKVRLSGLEEQFLHLTSAGNVPPGFPEFNEASENSSYSAAAVNPDLQSGGVIVPNLTNVLVIESGLNTPAPPYVFGCLDKDSFIGGHLSAIGVDVWSLLDATTRSGNDSGTSMATPQVAGLASYVWALAPDLTPQQVAGVLQATARQDSAYPLIGVDGQCLDDVSSTAPPIDAYDAVLSVDAAALPDRTNAPVRLAILDADDDGDFDADDLRQFVDAYIDPQTGQPRVPGEPDERDFSRWDLNGNGKTGGSTTAHFDLDRVHSTQYGLSHYDPVTQLIEGVPISFEENDLTDLDILCYYAYSALFTGAGGAALTDADRQKRTELLDPISHCMAVSMEVVFPTTIAPGTDTLLVVRVLNDLGGLPIAGLPIELTPSGGTVDDFAGVTDEEGFFQTRARLFSGSTQITIGITARGQAGGPVVAQRTVQATVPLTFTFDTDLQGWVPEVAATGNFNNAEWTLLFTGDGAAVLDGTDGEPQGTPDGEPNSWISRAIQIPSGATTLEFDTAPHNRHGSDSALRVRLVDSHLVSHTVLDWEVLATPACNTDDCPPEDHFFFVHRSAEISAFAGQSVTIFFEQGDNGPGSNEQRYIDNISIH